MTLITHFFMMFHKFRQNCGSVAGVSRECRGSVADVSRKCRGNVAQPCFCLIFAPTIYSLISFVVFVFFCFCVFCVV